MRTSFHSPFPVGQRRRAFTVTELLVAVSIMTLVVFALYQMFNQTQKALRGNITQVDVLESGRAAMEVISRELEQITASGLGGATNFSAGLSPYYQLPNYQPIVQTDLDDRTPLRTNVLQEFYFQSRMTNTWTGTGYRVIGADQGVGVLYRFSVSTNFRFLSSNNLSRAFALAPLTDPISGFASTNYHRLADGIVHLRLTAYDLDGRALAWRSPNQRTNVHRGYRVAWQTAADQRIPLTENVILRQDLFPKFPDQTKLIFLSNALPAFLEVELGVLEPSTLVQYRSLKDSGTKIAQDFLKTRASRVHLFRQRIPIRTASQ